LFRLPRRVGHLTRFNSLTGVMIAVTMMAAFGRSNGGVEVITPIASYEEGACADDVGDTIIS